MTAVDTVLSVREAVAYLGARGLHLSERHVRRNLARGTWPMTRTASGRYGVWLPSLAALVEWGS